MRFHSLFWAFLSIPLGTYRKTLGIPSRYTGKEFFGRAEAKINFFTKHSKGMFTLMIKDFRRH